MPDQHFKVWIFSNPGKKVLILVKSNAAQSSFYSLFTAQYQTALLRVSVLLQAWIYTNIYYDWLNKQNPLWCMFIHSPGREESSLFEDQKGSTLSTRADTRVSADNNLKRFQHKVF